MCCFIEVVRQCDDLVSSRLATQRRGPEVALSTTNVKHKGRAPSIAGHACSAPRACNESKLLLFGQPAPVGEKLCTSHSHWPKALEGL